jgi:hypothetical protein
MPLGIFLLNSGKKRQFARRNWNGNYRNERAKKCKKNAEKKCTAVPRLLGLIFLYLIKNQNKQVEINGIF